MWRVVCAALVIVGVGIGRATADGAADSSLPSPATLQAAIQSLPRPPIPSIDQLIGREVIVTFAPLSTGTERLADSPRSSLPADVQRWVAAIDQHILSVQALIAGTIAAGQGSVTTVEPASSREPMAGPVTRPLQLNSPFAIGSFRGYSGVFSRDILSFILAQPSVLSVELNSPVRPAQASSFPLPLPWLKIEPATGGASASSASGATPSPAPFRSEWSRRPAMSWGLDRVDQRSFPLDGQFVSPASGGRGVTIYMLDTGCNVDHPEFGGRARWGTVTTIGASKRDMWGHGTHTSGVIASKNYGIANKADLVMIKCFNDEGVGSIIDVVNGLQWIWNDLRNASDGRVANLINMSLGGGFSNALNRAVAGVVEQGIPIVTAAGNNGGDACSVSPASVGGDVVTVSATNIADGVPSYANGGSCVHMYAPGDNITSTWKDAESYALLSGTSVATPHVTGVAALILSELPNLSPKQLKEMLLSCASAGRVQSASVPQLAVSNRLLFQCDGSSSAAPTTGNPAAPTAGSGAAPGWFAGLFPNAPPQQQQQTTAPAPVPPQQNGAASGGAAIASLPTPPPPLSLKGASACYFGVCLNFG